MINELLRLLALATALAGGSAHAADQTLTIASGAATFNAIGKPGFLRINGEGGVPQGTVVLDGDVRLVKVEVKVPLATLETGIALRDEHMKEKYLEVGKFPEATFAAADVKLPGGGLPKEISVPGTLTIHGVSRPATLPVSLSKDGAAVNGSTEFEIKLGDFGIDLPSFMGVTVAETVKVHSEFVAK